MDDVDAATVHRLRLTSSPGAAWRAYEEERTNTPVYPRPGVLVWDLPVCAASDCFAQFVPEPGTHQRYCSATCQRRAACRRREGVMHRGRRAAVAGAVLARRQREVA